MPSDDILLTILSTGEVITLKEVFGRDWKLIEKIEFADQTTISLKPTIDEFARISATDGDDVLTGTDAFDLIEAGAGDDEIIATSGPDYIDGGDGFDHLSFEGQGGNDELHGGAGNDRYEWSLGDGSDLIVESGDGIDNIAILSDVASQQVSFVQIGRDLVIGFAETEETITLKDQFTLDSFYNGNGLVEMLTLLDGTVFDLPNIFSDIHLYGTDGAETLTKKEGNDTLHGEAGSDVYIWGVDYGHDTIVETEEDFDYIQLTPEITLDLLSYERIGSDLVLTISNTMETLTLKDHFASTGEISSEGRVEAVYFADGSSLDLINIDLQIVGTDQDDLISGEGGNDTISSGLGADTIIWGTGSGHDCIVEYGDDIDQVVLSDDLRTDIIDFYRSGRDLIITLKNSEDSLTLKNHFLETGEFSNESIVEKLQFFDGSEIDLTNIKLLVEGTDENDILNGSASIDIMFGGLGSDLIFGGKGNDWLEGGRGADILTGGSGFDTFYGSVEEFNGDIITDFEEGDILEIWDLNQGSASFNAELSALEIDQDLDGIIDSTIYLEGDFRYGTWKLEGSYYTYHSPFSSIIGTELDDVIISTDDQEILFGFEGSDVFAGFLYQLNGDIML